MRVRPFWFLLGVAAAVTVLVLPVFSVPQVRAARDGGQGASAPMVSAPMGELVAVGFSPGGDAEKLVLGVINGARRELRVAAYTFTSRPVADALLRAKKRGVHVSVVLNEPKPSESPFILSFLREHKIPHRFGACAGLMHNKFIVADGQTVQTGSFNYTRAAARVNAENVVVLRGQACAAVYLGEWKRLWDEAGAASAKPAARR